MLRRIVVCGVFVWLAASPLFAQEWARKMFKDTSHDFGTVARGAKAEFAFEFTNIYVEDVHVTGVRSSCGCTSVRVDKPTLKTYEKGAIIATFNTNAFQGQRGATLTITFDKPYYAEVQLHDSGYIRSDLVLNPGSVQFGPIEQGSPAQSQVALTYYGRSDWKITGVRTNDSHVTAEAVETRRGNGQVGYNLVVRLSGDAPVGYVNDQLLLTINDGQSTQVPVAVEGLVRSSISVSPASLFMGVVPPGEKVTKQLVVKGAKPFRIKSISCDDKDFTFDTSGADAPKTLHLIPVTFAAGDGSSGKVSKTIRIETDLGNCSPELSAYAVISRE